MLDRDILFKRIKEDLIGPKEGINEEIYESPLDRYYSGILYAQNSEFSSDEVDNSLNANSEHSSVEEEETEEEVSLFKSFKPSTAGISFNISKKDEKSQKVLANIQCGKYFKETKNTEKDLQKNEVKHKIIEENYWKRKNISFSQELILENNKSISLNRYGLDKIRLYIRKIDTKKYSIVTLQLINDFIPIEGETDYDTTVENTLFQLELNIECLGSSYFIPRQSKIFSDDEESSSSNLIYRKVQEFASGHNCSVSWKKEEKGNLKISLDWMPKCEVKNVSPLGDDIIKNSISSTKLKKLSAFNIYNANNTDLFELLYSLKNGYEKWISSQEKNILQENLSSKQKLQAEKNIKNCKLALKRIEEGVEYLKTNEQALNAFRYANLAMHIQSCWAKGIKSFLSDAGEENLIWRPFQLAYGLLTIISAGERSHKDRDYFDLIWFPTGGGKTEAYLLVSSFILFLRRIRQKNYEGGGVAVIMRYTLRTLTIQQFQRAAAVICACEYIRKENPEYNLGREKFSIGLWVGDKSTPNKIIDAVTALKDSHAPSTPKQIKYCPACKEKSSLLWKANSDELKITVECSNNECPIKYLPIMTVDEVIYNNPPSLLIGTVDKFTLMVRQKKVSNLFGIDNEKNPPDLIIQDELHLITGPLGTISGLYEIAIDELCKTKEGICKIIGSTATIRNAKNQINSLYSREAFLFPPSAIDEQNSGFAKKDIFSSGRVYVGISTAGQSPKYLLQALAASLLQGFFDENLDQESKEYYSTLVAYFNSLKELGGALTLMQDDVPITINARAKLRNETPRNINNVEELTSRKKSSEIPEILESLKVKSGKEDFIDILLASNMLSVGVDIPRLGMMIVNGQPKTISEYIQATSRVGRTIEGPGIIFTIFNHNKIRDRAFYETFQSWHQSLYRSVEPTSITPFASRARDKALHAPLIAILRLKEKINQANLKDSTKNIIKNKILPIIKERIKKIDPKEYDDASNDLDRFIEFWEEKGNIKYFWNDRFFNQSLMISAEKEAARLAFGLTQANAKATPMSVRNVEPSVLFSTNYFKRVDDKE